MAEEAPASRRMSAVYAALFPWLVPIIVANLVVQALGPSRQVGMIILLPLTAIATAGACYAGLRVTSYGWRFDRTPPAAPWTETENGSRLVQALRRVTLNGLSSVTLETRLRSDLRLSGDDMSALFDVLGLRPEEGSDLTVEVLLDAMNSSALDNDAI